jgi:hypothetical protein
LIQGAVAAAQPLRIALREKANPFAGKRKAAIMSGSSVLVVMESGLAARQYIWGAR